MKRNQVTKGIFLILIAIIISIGIFFPTIQVGFWSAVTMLVLLYILVKSLVHRNFAVSGFCIASLLTLTTYVYEPWYELVGLPYISTWTLYIVLLLIGTGLTLIFGKKRGVANVFYWDRRSNFRGHHGRQAGRQYNNNHNQSKNVDDVIDVEYNEVNEDDTDMQSSPDDYINEETNFGSIKKFIQSTNFRGGTVECNFGDVKLDFSQAELSPHGADLKIECNFGSTRIILPRHWSVRNTMTCSLGSLNDDRIDEYDTQTPQLLLRGDVSFGSLDILYV